MTIKEKLSALRAIMERESLDAYIISGTDPHNSEYYRQPGNKDNGFPVSQDLSVRLSS